MTHPTIRAFSRVSGQLAVGDVPIERLAKRVGGTPFFAYDRRLLTERVEFLRRSLPTQIDLSYAIKANPMPAIVQYLSKLVDGLDVASGSELLTALDTEISPSRIGFAGPGKTSQELRQAVAAGVTIELESATEAARVIAIGDEEGITPRVAIRVNPDFEVRGSGMRLGGGSQPFGVDAEQVPPLVKDLERAGVEFLGFHVFAGSQNLQTGILVEAQRKTIDLILRLASSATAPIEYVNIGGGFGIPYFEQDRPLDLGAISDNLGDLMETTILPELPKARVVVELGRYIVGECGVYVTRIVDRKESRGQIFLVTDGGLHHQLAATGNLGQVIRRNYPVAIGNRIEEEPIESATVVGCLCTPLDILGAKVNLPYADVGDLVVVFHAGAYGLTASPTAFLSHPMAAEVLV